jgi:hypothetical protein
LLQHQSAHTTTGAKKEHGAMRLIETTSRWFDVPNDPDNARLKIKHLTPYDLSEITDKCFKHEVIYKDQKKGKGKRKVQDLEPEIKQINDPKLYRELPVLAAVVDWSGFYDQQGNELEYSEANVLRAIREIEGFIALVTELKERLADDIRQEKEAQVKN